MTSFQRARSTHDKALRRSSMLEAARRVGAGSGVGQVTLTAIAGLTGLHKSAVLRYFANREALLLELCAQEWRAWAAELHAAAVDGPPAAHDGAAELLSGSLERRPLFCDLLAQTPAVLEREAPVEAVRQFKLDVLDAVDVATGATQTITGLRREEARELVGIATLLTGTLWHVAHPPAAVTRVYRSDPRLEHACIDFGTELSRALRTFLAGLGARATGS